MKCKDHKTGIETQLGAAISADLLIASRRFSLKRGADSSALKLLVPFVALTHPTTRNAREGMHATLAHSCLRCSEHCARVPEALAATAAGRGRCRAALTAASTCCQRCARSCAWRWRRALASLGAAQARSARVTAGRRSARSGSARGRRERRLCVLPAPRSRQEA
eukprot:159760-Pleurochrysis_carterae.AAC.1